MITWGSSGSLFRNLTFEGMKPTSRMTPFAWQFWLQAFWGQKLWMIQLITWSLDSYYIEGIILRLEEQIWARHHPWFQRRDGDTVNHNTKVRHLKYFNRQPCLLWLSGLFAGLRSKGSLILFPFGAHTWVSGQVPRGGAREATTHWCFSLSFNFPSPLKINK